ncbi:MAG: O-methyltransferase [Chitinophagaceae bacterium]
MLTSLVEIQKTHFMELIFEKVQAYAEKLSTPENEILKQLNRETHLKMPSPHMLSGQVQGNLLTMISRMISPHRILEIGTFTGYSAICLAQGLSAHGLLYTLDINEELETICRKYFIASGLQDRIIQHFGMASAIIPTLKEVFDLVFIDADKPNYGLYYDLVFDQVRPGGFILADNILFHGEVLLEEVQQSSAAKAMAAFSRKIAEDPRVEQVLITLRDGLLLIRKK